MFHKQINVTEEEVLVLSRSRFGYRFGHLVWTSQLHTHPCKRVVPSSSPGWGFRSQSHWRESHNPHGKFGVGWAPKASRRWLLSNHQKCPIGKDKWLWFTNQKVELGQHKQAVYRNASWHFLIYIFFSPSSPMGAVELCHISLQEKRMETS